MIKKEHCNTEHNRRYDRKQNPCRIILETEIFARFAMTSEIEHLQITDGHYTDALVAPLKGATGLWVVYKWSERPFNFSVDAGWLEIVSPEACAKNPTNLTDPRRIVHLCMHANQAPGYIPSATDQSGTSAVPMTPYIRCRIPGQLDSASENDQVVMQICNYAMDRSRMELRKRFETTSQPARILSQAPGTLVVA